MAPHNKRSNKNKASQKKNVATRLMTISLIVDDYIYKKKTIHLDTAKSFAEEISSYKPLCKGDNRALQVIEKLTLFMKSIIEELSVKNFTTDVTPHLLENFENTTIATIEPERVIPILPTDDKQNQCCKNDTVTTLRAEATEDNDNVNNNMEYFNDVDLDRTLSNLSINCLADSLYNNTNDECEEIIKAIEEANVLKSNEVKNIFLSEGPKEIISKQQFISQDINIARSANTDERVIVDLTKEFPITLPMTTINSNSSQHLFANLMTTSKKTNSDNLEPSEASKIRLKQMTNSTCILNQDNNNLIGVGNATTKVNENDVITKELRKNNNKNRNKKEIPTQGVQKTPLRRKRAIRPAKEKNKKHDSAASKSVISNKSKANIHSTKRKGMDLSWVENIKYVREINTKEFYTTLNNLDNTFWKNLSVPTNWDNDVLK